MSTFDSIKDYLNTIGHIPLLTHDEELILARSIQEWVADRDSEHPNPRIARRGKRALDRMVKGNLRLVVSASKMFHNRAIGSTMLDLIQEGNIGLIKAAEKFDPSRGYKFSTYAYWWIRQAMHRLLAQNDRIIRLPTAATDILHNARHFTWRFRQEHDRWPTIEELAIESNVTPDTMQHYLFHASGCCSLDQPINNSSIDDPSNIASLVPSAITNDLDAVETAMAAEQLPYWMQNLTERESEVIQRAFGLNDHAPTTLADIGRDLGLCREAVRQSKERAMRKIRLAIATSSAA